MYYRPVYLFISIILISQLGLAHTPVTLSLNDALYDVNDCAQNLTLEEPSFELIDENFFNAIVEADFEFVKRALEAGASPNVFVARAVRKKRRSIYELISRIDRSALGLDPGVFVNATALHLAVVVGDPRIVRLFLESEDVRVDIKNFSRLTPFSLLAFYEHRESEAMVQLFIQHDPAPTQSDITYTFEQAVITENFPIIEAIARYAPESRVLKKLRYMAIMQLGRLGQVAINYLFLSSEMFSNRQKYYAAIRYLMERRLL